LNDSNCCLNHLQEGQIGKILRYKSGKTKLILGDTHYDVDLGMEAGFLQDLMSIDTNREQRNGDMIKLGEINAKLNATPDWEHLFSKATT
jgi:DNA-directed RNA polymerase III subunit RPC4